MEDTAVGDTVNVAHGVPALVPSGEIPATRATLRAAGDGFRRGEGRLGPGPQPQGAREDPSPLER